jgi:hypothetical protein
MRRLLQLGSMLLLLLGPAGAHLATTKRDPRASPQRGTAEQRAIAVIVHPSNPLSGLSLRDLQSFFLRQRTSWPNSSSVLLLNWEPRTPIRIAFDRRVLQMTPDEVAAYWIDRRIRGQGMPPRSLASATLIRSIVARQKDAISYVLARDVNRSVKVLAIGGKTPGDPHYPLMTSKAP